MLMGELWDNNFGYIKTSHTHTQKIDQNDWKNKLIEIQEREEEKENKVLRI